MLKEFRVQGYRGFKDEIVWSFVPAGDYDFAHHAVSETGLIKSGIVFGKNGSGKSNLGYALFDIINHLADGVHRDNDYYDNFVYANHDDGLVKFTYLFLFDGQELEYRYSKTENGELVAEELKCDGDLILSLEKNGALILHGFDFSDRVKQDIEQGGNAVSVVKFLLTSTPLPSGHYLLNLQSFVEQMLWFQNLDERRYLGLKSSERTLSRFILKNDLVDDLQKFLEETSEQSYSLLRLEGDEDWLYCTVDGELIPLLAIASTGTRSLFLLYCWMKQVEQQRASFVFIDEFDAFYHFALSKAVCKQLFNLPAQVFLSSHNTALISNDLLRPDCYFVIDGKSVRSLPQLTDKDLQWGHNLEKLYRGGAFEA
ncbi:MAG: ATP-binding protein [Porphyromonadaceae bacterium]|nr:ATP-binding protein [Porphyromonadaceae bacterium]